MANIGPPLQEGEGTFTTDFEPLGVAAEEMVKGCGRVDQAPEEIPIGTGGIGVIIDFDPEVFRHFMTVVEVALVEELHVFEDEGLDLPEGWEDRPGGWEDWILDVSHGGTRLSLFFDSQQDGGSGGDSLAVELFGCSLNGSFSGAMGENQNLCIPRVFGGFLNHAFDGNLVVSEDGA